MNRSEQKAEKRTRKIARGGLIAVLLIACGILVFFVGIDAHSSKVKYDINQLNKEIAEAQKEINNLEVQIKSASNITNIEQKALALGMIYPDVDQIIYITGDSEIHELALALMESVYQ